MIRPSEQQFSNSPTKSIEATTRLPTAPEVRRAADSSQRDHTHLQTCLDLLMAAFEQDDERGADLPYPVPEELARALPDSGFALDAPTHQPGGPTTVRVHW